MADVTTVPEILQPLMGKPSSSAPWCLVCGRTHPLEQHHVVPRSAGRAFEGGVELEKPALTLCGFGNNLRDADGREYCHGLAHHGRLHFRWNGRWERLLTDAPTPYVDALAMDGWRAL